MGHRGEHERYHDDGRGLAKENRRGSSGRVVWKLKETSVSNIPRRIWEVSFSKKKKKTNLDFVRSQWNRSADREKLEDSE